MMRRNLKTKRNFLWTCGGADNSYPDALITCLKRTSCRREGWREKARERDGDE